MLSYFYFPVRITLLQIDVEVANGSHYKVPRTPFGRHVWSLGNFGGGTPASNAAYLEALGKRKVLKQHANTVHAWSGMVCIFRGPLCEQLL